MALLKFDEINKIEELTVWLDSLKPSELMEPENVRHCYDLVWDLMEYLYVLGFNDAREELGVIAEEMSTFLPPDYEAEKKMALNKKYDGLTFSDRVQAYAEMGNKSDIIRVVETDGNRIYQSGGNIGAKGIAKTKTWRTMQDDRVRDTHDYLDGVTVPYDERFYTYDGDSARFPEDFALPSNNVNCRCYCEYGK